MTGEMNRRAPEGKEMALKREYPDITSVPWQRDTLRSGTPLLFLQDTVPHTRFQVFTLVNAFSPDPLRAIFTYSCPIQHTLSFSICRQNGKSIYKLVKLCCKLNYVCGPAKA